MVLGKKYFIYWFGCEAKYAKEFVYTENIDM